jgi:hypothetical protein
MPKSGYLTDAIADFARRRLITEINQEYTVVTMRITTPPKMLVITVKRSLKGGRKSRGLAFGHRLNIRQLLSEPRDCWYELRGVICHHNGNYFAVCRRQSFVRIDDTEIKEIAGIRDFFGRENTDSNGEPYLLFYDRAGEERELDRLELLESLNPEMTQIIDEKRHKFARDYFWTNPEMTERVDSFDNLLLKLKFFLNVFPEWSRDSIEYKEKGERLAQAVMGVEIADQIAVSVHDWHQRLEAIVHHADNNILQGLTILIEAIVRKASIDPAKTIVIDGLDSLQRFNRVIEITSVLRVVNAAIENNDTLLAILSNGGNQKLVEFTREYAKKNQKEQFRGKQFGLLFAILDRFYETGRPDDEYDGLADCLPLYAEIEDPSMSLRTFWSRSQSLFGDLPASLKEGI